MTAVESTHLLRSSGRGPRRRAVSRAPVRSDGNCLQQLASRRKVAGDVLVVSGHGSEFFAWAFMWIEHDNGLPSVFLEIVEWCYEIGISRDEHDAVEVLFHVVYEHLGCDVHIRTFLFGLPHGRGRNLFAGLARFLGERIARTEKVLGSASNRQAFSCR